MEVRCPTCGSPIDPTRAPVAAVRDGRIVTFCSRSCAEGRPQPAPSAAEPGLERQTSPEDPAFDEISPDEIFDPPAEPPRPRPRRRVRVVAVAALFLVGGMLITIIKAVSPSSPSDVKAEESPRHKATRPRHVAAANADAAAPEKRVARDPSLLYQMALRELRAMLDSPSRRVQRIAASALARVKDPKALARLRKLIDREPNRLNQIQIAYALARAGKHPGRQVLIVSLRSRRRDVRLDAARSLVQLGEDSGNRILNGMMEVRQYRISTAGLLARRGDKRAVKVLHKIVRKGRSVEERQRAAVALGLAGDPSVKEQLLALLKGPTHVGAAHALAALGEKSAIASLTRQLDFTALRVEAARSLRRLGATVDLAPLAAALESDHEVSRVTAAEAILILTGPKKRAEVN